jgi:hypothetical protein
VGILAHNIFLDFIVLLLISTINLQSVELSLSEEPGEGEFKVAARMIRRRAETNADLKRMVVSSVSVLHTPLHVTLFTLFAHDRTRICIT